jgi:hypothetical protein
VWLTNESNYDTLILLIDLDKKLAETDCADVVRHLVECNLSGRGYVERSVGGDGLYVYFFVETCRVKRERFNGLLAHVGAVLTGLWVMNHIDVLV